jgi:hypothetical protein
VSRHGGLLTERNGLAVTEARRAKPELRPRTTEEVVRPVCEVSLALKVAK